jgi:hypothetical protein
MATELRPDIAAAKAKLKAGTFGSGRELKKLPGYLEDGETVAAITSGTYASGIGLLALTDRRLLFIRDGVFSNALQDFRFDRISSVQWVSGLMLGTIQITVSGSRADITNVYKEDGRVMADLLRNLASQPPAAATAASSSVADELTKFAALHAQGVLTDEEFSAKKAALLA